MEEFLCNASSVEAPADPNAFAAGATTFAPLVGGKIRDLGQNYSIHHLKSAVGDTAVLHDGHLVGFYCGEMLAVRRDHQGDRLAVPLILEAVPYRALPTKRTLSSGGRAALARAWRVANGEEDDPWPQSAHSENRTNRRAYRYRVQRRALHNG